MPASLNSIQQSQLRLVHMMMANIPYTPATNYLHVLV
jgi:hypothetical protein